MNAQRGLSAIEVIVLILVLAVVAVIAIPAWRTHLIRNLIADAFKVTDATKLVVMGAATVHGGLTDLKADELNYSPAGEVSQYVAHITIAVDGRINLSTKDTSATPDPVMLLSPSENSTDNNATPISWTCNVIIGDPDLVPASCRTVMPVTTALSAPVNTVRATATASSAH